MTESLPAIFRACSGQSYFTRKRNPSAPDWGICLNDNLYMSCPWWRATNKGGADRRFHSFEAAEKFRAKLEAAIAPNIPQIESLRHEVTQGGGDARRSAFGDAVTAFTHGMESRS